jgi:hypothetical protein
VKKIICAAAVALLLSALEVLAHGSSGGHGGGGFILMYGGQRAGIPRTDVGDYSKVHKIGLLLMLGDNFDVIPKSTVPHPDISSWQINALVRDTLQKYLASKYELIDVPFDHSALAAMPEHMMRESKTDEYLKTIANPGVDAYVIVRPAGDFLPGTPGLGIDLGRNGRAFVWTNFEIDIVDSQKFSYIGKAYSRQRTDETGEPDFAANMLTTVPSYSVMMGMTPAQLEAVHREVEDLLPRALVETIRSLQMGVSLPPMDDHSISTPAQSITMQTIHTVAVASAIGDSFHFVNPGNLFTEETKTQIPFGDSGIDDKVEEIARNVLAHHYTVKSAPMDRAAMAQMLLVPGMPTPFIPGLKPTDEVDAYVLIVKATMERLPFPGLGLFHFTPLVNHETGLYADFAIVVVNAHTLKPLAARIADDPQKQVCPKTYVHYSLLECDVSESMWPDAPDKLTPASMTQIRAQLVDLVSGGVPETLFRLGLDAPTAQ